MAPFNTAGAAGVPGVEGSPNCNEFDEDNLCVDEAENDSRV